MKGLAVLTLFAVGAYLPVSVQPCFLCLILGSSYKCPEAPSCCESGFYALDECGCCKKCAKAELQSCGGPSDATGRCAQGLQCLKTCLSCKTVGESGVPCIFPYIYRNTTYDRCTTKDSDTGQPWCATSVDHERNVIDFAWGDCSEGCPGTSFECDDKYFSLKEGTCIDKSVPGAVPNWFGAPTVYLDEPTEVLFPAPLCKSKINRREYENTCRCDTTDTAITWDSNGISRGNCTGYDKNTDDNINQIWCFLENIRDPREPVSGCYQDTTWSAKDARFWSSEACDHRNSVAPAKSVVWRKPVEESTTTTTIRTAVTLKEELRTRLTDEPLGQDSDSVISQEYESYDYLFDGGATHSVQEYFADYEYTSSTNWPDSDDDYMISSQNERESRKIALKSAQKRNPTTNNKKHQNIQLSSTQLSPKVPGNVDQTSSLTIALPLFNDDEIFQRITTVMPIEDEIATSTTTFNSLSTKRKTRSNRIRKKFQKKITLQ